MPQQPHSPRPPAPGGRTVAQNPRAREPQDLTHPLQALGRFTDREEALAAFDHHFNAKSGHFLPVLHFFGVGGIGKSLLLRKIQEDLNQQRPAVPLAVVDFSEARDRDRLGALTTLRVELGRQGIPFPEFDLIRAVLAVKDGSAEPDLFAISPWFKAVLSTLQALPVAGDVLGALKDALGHALVGLRRSHPGLEAKLRRRWGESEVLRLCGLGKPELFTYLLQAFAAELSENAPLRGGKACRAVLMLDTYEALWTGTEGPTSPQGREVDAWIRQLYAYLSHGNTTLLVITGRDCLRWPEVDPNWAQLGESELGTFLAAHLISGLSAPDAQRYLSHCGVGPPPEKGQPTSLQAALIDCCSAGRDHEGCLPFYLGLCANIVLNERHQNRHVDPPPASFRGIPSAAVAQRLAARFLSSLAEPNLAELVRDLSLTRWFDSALVKDRLQVGDIQARTAFSRITEFSFAEPRADGRWRLHAIMREALQYQRQEQGEDSLRALQSWFRDHFAGRQAAGEAGTEVEAWYQGLHVAPLEALGQWSQLAAAAVQAPEAARRRELVAWWEDGDLAEGGWLERMETEEGARALFAVGYWLQQLRPFAWQHTMILQRAITCYEAALRVYTEAAFPQDWARTQNNLGTAYWSLPTGDRSANLQRAIACYEAALRVRTEADFPQDWAMTQNNLGNAYGDLPTGDRGANLQRAIACYEAALRVRTEADFPQQWADTEYNRALALRELAEVTSDLHLQQEAQAGFLRAARGYRTAGLEEDAREAEAQARRETSAPAR